MKYILTSVLLFTCAVLYGQNSGYPINVRNTVLGYQTTPEGIFYRGDTTPTFTPEKRYGTFMYVDTVLSKVYMYMNPTIKWKRLHPDSLSYNSATQILTLKGSNDIALVTYIDTTLKGYNTALNPLRVDTTVIATKYDISTFSASLNGEVVGKLDSNRLSIVDRVVFDETYTAPDSIGKLQWNNTDGTLNLGLKGGSVTLQIGQEEVVRVVNKTNTNLLESEYKAVRVSSAQGQRLAVNFAQANAENTSASTLGIVTENINNNSEGFITVSGKVNNINTTGSLQGETWVDGDVLFLSSTVPGGITKIRPTAPNHTVIIGWVVYAHQNNGSIFVKIDNGYELDELHNVNITSPADKSLLRYDVTDGVWKDTLINNIVSGTGTANQITYWSGTNTQTGSSSLIWNNADKELTVINGTDYATLKARAEGATITYSNAGDYGWAFNNVSIRNLWGNYVSIPHQVIVNGTTDPKYSLVVNGTDAMRPPAGTDANRDLIITPPAGLFRYNTTSNKLEYRDNTAWKFIQPEISISTNGNSGAATFSNNVLNIPRYKGNFLTINNASDVTLPSSPGGYPNNYGLGINDINGNTSLVLSNPGAYSDGTKHSIHSYGSIEFINGITSIFGFVNRYSYTVGSNDTETAFMRYNNIVNFGGTGYNNVGFSWVDYGNAPEGGNNTNYISRAIKIGIATRGIEINSGSTNHALYVGSGKTYLQNVGIKTVSPVRELHVEGKVRITDLTTDTPTRIVGADADGDLDDITIGTGLALTNGILSSISTLKAENGIAIVNDTIVDPGIIDTMVTNLSNMTGIAYGNNVLVAVRQGNTSSIYYSYKSEMFKFTAVSGISNQPLKSIAFGRNVFVTVGTDNVGYRSTDGVNWDAVTIAPSSGTDYDWKFVKYVGNAFYAISDSTGTKSIATSTDGVTWSIAPITFNAIDIEYYNNLVIVSATNGNVYSTTNFATFNTIVTGTKTVSLQVFKDAIHGLTDLNGVFKLKIPPLSLIQHTGVTGVPRFISSNGTQFYKVMNVGATNSAYIYQLSPTFYWSPIKLLTSGSELLRPIFVDNAFMIANVNGVIAYTGSIHTVNDSRPVEFAVDLKIKDQADFSTTNTFTSGQTDLFLVPGSMDGYCIDEVILKAHDVSGPANSLNFKLFKIEDGESVSAASIQTDVTITGLNSVSLNLNLKIKKGQSWWMHPLETINTDLSNVFCTFIIKSHSCNN